MEENWDSPLPIFILLLTSFFLHLSVYRLRFGKEIGERNPSLYLCRPQPTVNFSPRRLVEVFIPEVSRELYGERLTIEFQAFLREEMVFPSLSELKNQIEQDLEALRITTEQSAISPFHHCEHGAERGEQATFS